jgi:hypothetical protein
MKISIYMKVVGTKADRDDFIETIKSSESDFDFNMIDPTPSIDELGHYEHIEDWQSANWGSTNAEDVRIEHSDEKTEVRFKTPMYPPISIFINLSRKFRKLYFEIDYASEDEFDDLFGRLKMHKGVDHDNNELKLGEVETYKFILDTTEYGADCCLFELCALERSRDIKNLELAMIEVVYEAKLYDESLPKFVEKILLDKALEEEDYEYAIRIRDKKSNIFSV